MMNLDAEMEKERLESSDVSEIGSSQNKHSAKSSIFMNEKLRFSPDYEVPNGEEDDDMLNAIEVSDDSVRIIEAKGRRCAANMVIFNNYLGHLDLGHARSYFLNSIIYVSSERYLQICIKVQQLIERTQERSITAPIKVVDWTIVSDEDWAEFMLNPTLRGLRRHISKALDRDDVSATSTITRSFSERSICEHFVLLECCKVLKKRGTRDKSIQTTLVIPTTILFKWLIGNVEVFRGTTINTLPIRKIEQEHLQMFRGYLIDCVDREEFKSGTVRQYFFGIRKFFKVACGEGHIEHSPMDGIKNLDKPKEDISKESGTFQHPVVVACSEALRKRGTQEKSITATLITPVKTLFEWLVFNIRSFDGHTINTIPVWNIEQEHLLEFRSYLKNCINDGIYKPGTSYNYFVGVRKFFKIAYSEGRILKNPMGGVGNLPQGDAEELNLPSVAQIEQFFKVILKYADNVLVDFTAFTLMLAFGMRQIEVAKLQWENVNFRDKTITFWRKLGGYHTLPLPESVLRCFALFGNHKTGPIFTDKASKFKLYLYRRYRVYEVLAGWHRGKGPHIFRHVFISGLTLATNDIRRVMYIANHRSPALIMRYTHRSKTEQQTAVNHVKIRRYDNAFED